MTTIPSHPFRLCRDVQVVALADTLDAAISAARDFQAQRHDDFVIWTAGSRIAAIVLYQGGVLRVIKEEASPAEGQTR